jgi:large subunit ribosomal protein L33
MANSSRLRADSTWDLGATCIAISRLPWLTALRVLSHPRTLNRNDYHFQNVIHTMSRSTLRPVIKLRSTAGTGYTYVTRKSRRNDPDRLVIRKYDPVAGRHVEFREER